MTAASRWNETDGSLVAELEFDDFAEAFAFVTRVALVAQARDHHPDISISWNRVTLTLTSHDAGRTVTRRDRDLAGAIDDLLQTPRS